MDYEQLTAMATDFLLAHEENHVRPEDALRPDMVGMQIYDAPIFAVGAADDPLFVRLSEPQAVHPDYMLPVDWLPGARSVISFFVPYTERIRKANAQDMRHASDEWRQGRYEGEKLLAKLRLHVRDLLVGEGHAAVAPLQDPRYTMLAKYAPNWAERHTGYVCGLGTFGLSKGLITQKGVAGRIGSVVTDYAFPVTPRTCSGLYDHCNQCGQCAVHCPVRAIVPSRGPDAAKAHPPCDVFLKHTETSSPPDAQGRTRYGCGKCQVAVPCESGIPKTIVK